MEICECRCCNANCELENSTPIYGNLKSFSTTRHREKQFQNGGYEETGNGGHFFCSMQTPDLGKLENYMSWNDENTLKQESSEGMSYEFEDDATKDKIDESGKDLMNWHWTGESEVRFLAGFPTLEDIDEDVWPALLPGEQMYKKKNVWRKAVFPNSAVRLRLPFASELLIRRVILLEVELSQDKARQPVDLRIKLKNMRKLTSVPEDLSPTVKKIKCFCSGKTTNTEPLASFSSSANNFEIPFEEKALTVNLPENFHFKKQKVNKNIIQPDHFGMGKKDSFFAPSGKNYYRELVKSWPENRRIRMQNLVKQLSAFYVQDRNNILEGYRNDELLEIAIKVFDPNIRPDSENAEEEWLAAVELLAQIEPSARKKVLLSEHFQPCVWKARVQVHLQKNELMAQKVTPTLKSLRRGLKSSTTLFTQEK